MAWFNPFSWFRKSQGERKIVALMPSLGWMPVSWSANRHELVGHMRGWTYVATHAFAEALAEQVPQLAIVEDETSVRETLTKAWFSKRNLRADGSLDRMRQAKRVARARAKYLGRMRRKKAMAQIQEGDELVPLPATHRLCRLIRKPNPRHSWWDVGYMLAMWKRLAGGAYIYKHPGNDGKPSGLWPLPPNWLRPLGGALHGKLIDRYEVRPAFIAAAAELGIGWMLGAGGGDTIPAEQIITIGYPHPTHYLDFYSPLTAGAEWVECAEAIDASRIATFQNGAYPGVMLEIDPEMADPLPEDMDRLKAKVKAAYSGVKNRGEPVILDKGITMKPWNLTAVEMDYVASARDLRDNQLALHRTGGSIVGLAEQTTFASMIASRANYYQGMIRPNLVHLGLALTNGLCADFADEGNIVCYFDDPTPKDPAQLNADIQADSQIGAITVNEVRAERGREPYPYGGDDPCLPMGVAPMPWATGQEDDWAPPPGAQQQQRGEDPVGSLLGGDGTGEEQDQPADALSRLTDTFARGASNGKAHHNGDGAALTDPPKPLTEHDIERVVTRTLKRHLAHVGDGMATVGHQVAEELARTKDELAERMEAVEQAATRKAVTGFKIERTGDGIKATVEEGVPE